MTQTALVVLEREDGSRFGLVRMLNMSDDARGLRLSADFIWMRDPDVEEFTVAIDLPLGTMRYKGCSIISSRPYRTKGVTKSLYDVEMLCKGGRHYP